MNRGIWKETVAVLVFLIAATIIIAWTNADIVVSSWFFVDGSWPIGELFPWKMLYHVDRIPGGLLAFAGLMAAAASMRWPSWRRCARGGVFLALLFALGPGLMVNTIFKDVWGRPRPREIVQFCGEKQFLQPWQKGVTGKGRSFPSGHASAAFYMSAPYFVYRRSRKRLAYTWLAGGSLFGILMSIARIAQGGHFLSDNLWSWGMVYLCGLFLAAVLKLDQAPPATSTTTT